MPQLPPPPRFILPPPPIPPSDIFDLKMISQLTCSSIRQQQHYQPIMTNSHLTLFTSACVIAAIIIFTITLIIWLLSSRKQKQSYNNQNTKPTATIDSISDLSICSSRSYETVSSHHTGIYLESVDTSATTCSADTTVVICIECSQQHGFQPAPYYHILSIPDVVPN